VKRLTRALLIVFLLLSVCFPSWSAQTLRLTILHTNDLHGMMQPFDYEGGSAFLAGKHADMGGMVRRATLIKSLRKQTKNPLVVIDTGDIFTRGPWHTRHFGMPEIEAMNLMGYDMLCVGNNEFKATAGPESKGTFLLLMRRSRFPWLAANLTVEGLAPVEGVHPFIVRTFGDVRVGFLGLTAPRAAGYPQTVGWRISDPLEAAKYWVPIARKECDILIAITHIGEQMDQQLAAQVEAIDAIVGGDSHSFIPAPIMVRNPAGIEVPIVQAGEHGVVLGRFDLTFRKIEDWRLVHSEEQRTTVEDHRLYRRRPRGKEAA